MRGSSIFSWPNPWFWAALEGIILVGNIKAGNFGTFVVWNCILVLIASLIYWTFAKRG
ncbi:MAG: hypothetical protein GKR89_32620 [Candidatus Latescibacteria bacterium]|nr:hypothetical protein [Candidatus Latescibacterota bacterium]